MSKVFESFILLRCEQFLTTADNQFGFKSGHSTDFCIYTLKEFIEYYKQRNTTIFVTFLDASKAFDRIDHWLLFKKLIDKHVPLFIIRLFVAASQYLSSKYNNQKVWTDVNALLFNQPKSVTTNRTIIKHRQLKIEIHTM